MDKLEQVETLVQKCGVSYTEAKEALEACEYDTLDAIIYLEKQGKVNTTAHVQTEGSRAAGATGPSYEMIEAQAAFEERTKKGKFAERMDGVWDYVKKVFHKGMEVSFVAERGGDKVISLPVLIVILTIFIWWAAFPLLIVGLFFGFRYRVDGIGPVTVDINEAMDKASDAAESIKADFAKDDEDEEE